MTATTTRDAMATDARAQVEANQRRLYDAWQARDEARLRKLFSHRADLMLWGTDQFERIVGRGEADRDFGAWIATCPPWTSMAPTHRVIGGRDDLVWVADEVEGRWARDGEHGTMHYRATWIWEKVDGEWAIVHANVASPH